MQNKILVLISIIVFLNFPIQAQNIFPFACSNEKSVSEQDYKNWHENDVLHIIHNDEKKEYLGLKTKKKRDVFIEQFWLRRDSNYITISNEFQEEYCKRASETYPFTTDKTPGWKTDRGRVYILIGKPNEIEIGYGDFDSLKNVLFEKWIYRYMSGMRLLVEYRFYNPTYTNEYVLSKQDRNSFDAAKYFPVIDFDDFEISPDQPKQNNLND